MTNARTRAIAELNDTARTTFIGCKLLLTSGVSELDQDQKIFTLVREYNTFNEDNDPYGEHDFGRFELAGKILYWKIDYYDQNAEH
jgi:hypothetical protein